MRVNKTPEIHATIQELVLNEGGEIAFSPFAFCLTALEFHVFVEFVGSKAQLAAEFGLNAADKIVSKALDACGDHAKHHAKRLGTLGRHAANAAGKTASAAASAAKDMHTTAKQTVKDIHCKVKETTVGAIVQSKAESVKDVIVRIPNFSSQKTHDEDLTPKDGEVGQDDDEICKNRQAFTMHLITDMEKEKSMDHVVVKIHDLKTSIKFLEKALLSHRLRAQVESHMSKKATEVIAKKLHEKLPETNNLGPVDQVVFPRRPGRPMQV